MDEERKGLSGYGDMVNIRHMHIKDSVAPEKSFISLDINIDKSIHWNMTSRMNSLNFDHEIECKGNKNCTCNEIIDAKWQAEKDAQWNS